MSSLRISCSLCSLEFDCQQKRVKQSRSGLLFCSRAHKDEALRLARGGDSRFEAMIPAHYGASSRRCKDCGKQTAKVLATGLCRSCLTKTNKAKKVDSWLNGTWDGSKAGGELNGVIRNWVLEQANYACTKCRWSEMSPSGTIPVEVDHIDGNWRNHSRENLRVLCPNCHALTDNWKSRNKPEGQSRYAYYKDRSWW